MRALFISSKCGRVVNGKKETGDTVLVFLVSDGGLLIHSNDK